MSSHPPTNENLSAYFDHEVSPEERQELESLLEHSAEARQELHEMGEISRLLQETATESAPPELAASIRRRIEQETLLTETIPVAVKRAPSLLRYRIAVAISTCSSVAALVLFVLLMNIDETPRQFQSQDLLAYQPAPQSAGQSTLMLRENKPEVRLNSTAMPDTQGEKAIPAPQVAFNAGARLNADKGYVKEELANKEPTTRSFKGKFSVGNSIAEKKVRETLPRAPMIAPSQASGIPHHIPLDTIRIGDALPYFSDVDGRVAVIEVHVVDVKQALGTMELLLARNNIPVNQNKQSAVERQLKRSRLLKAKDTPDANSTLVAADEAANQLFAVYVEATDTQLASALQDFQKGLKRDQLVGLALQPAIKASSLTEELEELPQLLAERSNFADTKKDNNAAAGASVLGLKQKPVVADSPKRDTKPKKTVVAESVTKKREALRGRQDSYQMRYRMQLPAEQMSRRVKSGQLMKRQANSAQLNEGKQKAGKKIGQSDVPALVASKPNGTITKEASQNQSAAPVKVLFVFKDVVSPTTSPAPQ